MTENSVISPEAETDTGSNLASAPEQSAAPVTESAQTEQTAQVDSPADAAPNSSSPESLTSPPQDQETQPAAPQQDWAKEGPVLQKRYDDIRADYNRKINQWQQTYQSQNTQLTELQKFKQEQEQRAQAASLKPWSKLHPENGKFNGLLERARTIEKQLQSIDPGLPPEQQAAIKNAIVGALAPEERQQITDYRESLQTFQRDFFTDPQGTVMPMVDRMVEQKIQQYVERQTAQQSVAKDFADPQLAPLVEQYGSDFKKALEDKVPYDYAKHMLLMHAEIQKLRGENHASQAKVVSADERQRLAKGEAAITRDQRAPVRDSYELAKKEAKKRGITPDSPQFAGLLAKYA